MVDTLLQSRFAIRVENGPAPPRSIIVSRHTSFWDSVIVAMCDLRIKPLGNAYWFDHGAFRWYARHSRALPNDLRGLVRTVEHLRRDGLVWMAPAGFTAFEHRSPSPGAWRLAQLTDAWLVAATIDGLAPIPHLTLPRRAWSASGRAAIWDAKARIVPHVAVAQNACLERGAARSADPGEMTIFTRWALNHKRLVVTVAWAALAIAGLATVEQHCAGPDTRLLAAGARVLRGEPGD